MRESRLCRTTSIFYDKEYWDKYWRERFRVAYDENDESVVQENLKKKAWIEWTLRINTGRLLDVGCSFGFFVSFMRKSGWDALGVDVSEYALSLASEEVKPFLSQASITKIPFADDDFDLVTCWDIMEHLYIEEIVSSVKELTRVCRGAIVLKLPVWGFVGEQIVDQSYFSLDKSHVSVYPWEFWARRFVESGKFKLLNCSLWLGDVDAGGEGKCMEAWIWFRRAL